MVLQIVTITISTDNCKIKKGKTIGIQQVSALLLEALVIATCVTHHIDAFPMLPFSGWREEKGEEESGHIETETALKHD